MKIRCDSTQLKENKGLVDASKFVSEAGSSEVAGITNIAHYPHKRIKSDSHECLMKLIGEVNPKRYIIAAKDHGDVYTQVCWQKLPLYIFFYKSEFF